MTSVSISSAPALSEDDLYPTSDRTPLAESELHLEEVLDLRVMLRRYFSGERDHVTVTSNLFVYYRQGDPRAVFSPDVMVVRGAPQRRRDTYKFWKEGGVAPSCIIEVTSKSTEIEDRGTKKGLYEMLGVAEYFMYDPRAEYLDPPLKGFRLVKGSYQAIPLGDQGELGAETLGLSFTLGPDGLIVLRSNETGERLLRPEEETARADADRRKAESERRKAESERRKAESERQKAESERDALRRRAEEAERKLAEALGRSR